MAESRGGNPIRKPLELAAALAAPFGLAWRAAADRELFNNSHIQSGLTGLLRLAAFFQARIRRG